MLAPDGGAAAHSFFSRHAHRQPLNGVVFQRKSPLADTEQRMDSRNTTERVGSQKKRASSGSRSRRFLLNPIVSILMRGVCLSRRSIQLRPAKQKQRHAGRIKKDCAVGDGQRSANEASPKKNTKKELVSPSISRLVLSPRRPSRQRLSRLSPNDFSASHGCEHQRKAIRVRAPEAARTSRALEEDGKQHRTSVPSRVSPLRGGYSLSPSSMKKLRSVGIK